MFQHYARVKPSVNPAQKDLTLPVDEALALFQKAGFVQGQDGKPHHAYLKLEEFLAVVEKYYSPETRLDHKIHSRELFEQYLQAHPELVPARFQKAPEGEHTEEEISAFEARRKHQEEEELKHARVKFRKHTLCEHLIQLRGVELVYFEFREILAELALVKMPRDLVDPKKTGKVKGVLTRFLDEHFLKRVGALMRHSAAAVVGGAGATTAARQWPETEKDKLIRLKQEERRRQEEEQRLMREERERMDSELKQMSQEDTPALDEDQLEELRLRQ